MRSAIAISPVAALLATLLLLLRVTSAVPVTTEIAVRAPTPTEKEVISVSFYVDKIKEMNLVSGKTCLFYFRLNGAEGEDTARNWYRKYGPAEKGSLSPGSKKKDPVTYMDAAPSLFSYRLSMPAMVSTPPNMKNDKTAGDKITSRWIANGLVSQAVAESCEGDAYFFTPEGTDWTEVYPYKASQTNFWWDFEWPALLKNSKVNNVYQIDPTKATEVPKEPISTKGKVANQEYQPDKNRPLATGWEYDPNKAETGA
ncbi:hypothetical protein P170DRAFT_428392 [Aspergillus steynii IBT 23096]|uniref:Uncharacterized protein n=1 Tax=Aspergillus steynii IBT 23096 TaxID=1392250 RepID=A0A2I2G2S9_9EURO|nr:uncharacterized protein P170DRAFT_428392 [Aspergillus steynii IBT 23096]PLB47176.1 hypothetical protein P170DRAFT_428392 [Aspergillus steynii IBT 23096]